MASDDITINLITCSYICTPFSLILLNIFFFTKTAVLSVSPCKYAMINKKELLLPVPLWKERQNQLKKRVLIETLPGSG